MSLYQKTQQQTPSLTVSKELSQRCLFRKSLRKATGVGYQDAVMFTRRYWLLLGLHNELTCLLESTLCGLAHCQQGRCQRQAQADTLTQISYRYFASVLDLFKAHEPTGLVVSTAADERFGEHDQGQETHYYLQAKEIEQLVRLVNDAIAAVLTAAHADFPKPNEDADLLPAIYQTLRQYGYSSIMNLPIKHFSAHHRRAHHWADAHRFDVFELHLAPSGSDKKAAFSKVTLSYRYSKRHWYCGCCLSHYFERYCETTHKRSRRGMTMPER